MGSVRAIRTTLTVVLALVAALAAGAPESPARTDQRWPGHSHGPDITADLRHQLAVNGFEVGSQRTDPTGQAGSGGRAVVHLAGGKRVRSPELIARAPDARLYRTGYGTWEPTMGITSKGAVFMNGMDENSNPQVIASYDQGRSWKRVFNGHPTTADPYMYVDEKTSRIFANDLILPCHMISYSDDEGKTWETGPLEACGVVDHQTLFAGPPPKGGDKPEDYPNVVYFCGIGLGASVASNGSVCARSLDGGNEFLPTGEPAFINDPRQTGDFGVPGNCNGANAHGSVGPDGTVYLPRGWCGQPWLAMSKNEGLTWERVQVADIGMPCCADLEEGVEGDLHSHEAGVVADRKGNIYYVWVAADRLPYLVVSHDRGKTWGEPMMIASPGVEEALLPGLTMGSDGRLAIVYMGTENSPWNGKRVKGSYGKTRWNAYMSMTLSAAKEKPVFYSATVNDPRDPMWIGACGPDPIRCGWGDFFDVTVAPDGTPWATLVDLCPGRCVDGLGESVAGRLVGGPSLL